MGTIPSMQKIECYIMIELDEEVPKWSKKEAIDLSLETYSFFFFWVQNKITELYNKLLP